jgi:hypothetical protein
MRACYDSTPVPLQLSTEANDLRVPLNGFSMQLRRSEIQKVARGLGWLDLPQERDPRMLGAALCSLRTNDRAPAWELIMRRYGHGRTLPRAAGEVGLDEIVARGILARFETALARVTAPKNPAPDAGA